MYAIECVYYGNEHKGPILTRSHTEATWLHTLDAVNVPYQYEPFRFIKPVNPNTGRAFAYLPDLFLPLQNLVIEIKGSVENKFPLTDLLCLWHGKNEQLFEDMRQCLADPSSICFSPDEDSYVDCWVAAGMPDRCSVMQFARIQKDVDCFDVSFPYVETNYFAAKGSRPGICPVCGNLVLFNSDQLNGPRSADGQITVDCSICGDATFWPKDSREGLATYCAADNQIRRPFERAACLANSSSSKIVKAKRLNDDGTLYEFTRKGHTEPEQLIVKADLFTSRRGEV